MDVDVFVEAVATSGQIRTVFFQTTYEFYAVSVIYVDNGTFQTVLVRQVRLDDTIDSHRAVAVEMIPGEVDEDCATEWHVVNVQLVRIVTRNSHRGGCCTLLAEMIEQGPDTDGGGGGMHGFFQCAPRAVTDRADNGNFFVRQIGGLCQPLCNGDFVVDTGYVPDSGVI